MTLELVLENERVNILEDGFDISKVVDTMMQTVKTLIVESDNSLKQATHMWKQTRDWKKSVETQRKSITEPFRKQISFVNDKAKEVTVPLEEMENILETKINRYNKEKEKQRLEVIAAASAFDADASLPEIQQVHTPGVTTYKRKKVTITVLDIRQVPEKYLKIDEKAVEDAYKMGLLIPGLEIKEEEIIQMRSC
jgi:hypothetical protein